MYCIELDRLTGATHQLSAAGGISPRCCRCRGRWLGPSHARGRPWGWGTPGTRRSTSSSARRTSAPERWIVSLNFVTRTFLTSLAFERAIILTETNRHFNILKEEQLLTLERQHLSFFMSRFLSQHPLDDMKIALTWLCFTMALLSSIRPDKWLAMSAEWIRLSAKVLASSLRKKQYLISDLLQILCPLNTARD